MKDVNDSSNLTLKQLETHKLVLRTVATDALVLKHQAIDTTVLTKYSLGRTRFVEKYCILKIYRKQH